MIDATTASASADGDAAFTLLLAHISATAVTSPESASAMLEQILTPGFSTRARLPQAVLAWLAAGGLAALLSEEAKAGANADLSLPPQQPRWVQLVVSIPDRVANAVGTADDIPVVFRPANFSQVVFDAVCTALLPSLRVVAAAERSSSSSVRGGSRISLPAVRSLVAKLDALGLGADLLQAWIAAVGGELMRPGPSSLATNYVEDVPSGTLELLATLTRTRGCVGQLVRAAVALSDPSRVRSFQPLSYALCAALGHSAEGQRVNLSTRKGGIIAALVLLMGPPSDLLRAAASRPAVASHLSAALLRGSPPLSGVAARALVDYLVVDLLPTRCLAATDAADATAPAVTGTAPAPATDSGAPVTCDIALFYQRVPLLQAAALWSAPSFTEAVDMAVQTALTRIIVHAIARAPARAFALSWVDAPSPSDTYNVWGDSGHAGALSPLVFGLMGAVQARLDSPSDDARACGMRVAAAVATRTAALMAATSSSPASPTSRPSQKGGRKQKQGTHADDVLDHDDDDDDDTAAAAHDLLSSLPSLSGGTGAAGLADFPPSEMVDAYDPDWGTDAWEHMRCYSGTRSGDSVPRVYGRDGDDDDNRRSGPVSGDSDSARVYDPDDGADDADTVTAAGTNACAAVGRASPSSGAAAAAVERSAVVLSQAPLPLARLQQPPVIGFDVLAFARNGNESGCAIQAAPTATSSTSVLRVVHASRGVARMPLPAHRQAVPASNDVDAASERDAFHSAAPVAAAATQSTSSTRSPPPPSAVKRVVAKTPSSEPSQADIIARRLSSRAPTTLSAVSAGLREDSDYEVALATLATLPRLIRTSATRESSVGQLLVHGPSLLHLLLGLDDRFALPEFGAWRFASCTALCVCLGPLAVTNLYRMLWGSEQSEGSRAEILDILVASAGEVSGLEPAAVPVPPWERAEEVTAEAHAGPALIAAAGVEAVVFAGAPTAAAQELTVSAAAGAVVASAASPASSSPPASAHVNVFGEIAAEVYFYPLLRGIVKGHPYDAPPQVEVGIGSRHPRSFGQQNSDAALPDDILAAVRGDGLTLSVGPGRLLAEVMITHDDAAARGGGGGGGGESSSSSASAGKRALLSRSIRALAVFLEGARWDPSVPAMAASLFSLAYPLLTHSDFGIRRAALTGTAAVIAAVSRHGMLHYPSITATMPVTTTMPIGGGGSGAVQHEHTARTGCITLVSSSLAAADTDTDAPDAIDDYTHPRDDAHSSGGGGGVLSALSSVAASLAAQQRRDGAIACVLLDDSSRLSAYAHNSGSSHSSSSSSGQNKRSAATRTNALLLASTQASSLLRGSHSDAAAAGTLHDSGGGGLDGDRGASMWDDMCELAGLLRVMAETDPDDGVRGIAMGLLSNDVLRQLVMGPLEDV